MPTMSKMSREQFLDWASAQEECYEFDGCQPVPMTGRTIGHNMIRQNVYFSLHNRLTGSKFLPFGPGVGVTTIGGAVRCPDVLVTRSTVSGTDRLVPGVIVVFEVLSPTSSHVDRIIKPREYLAVKTIQRYVIVEYEFIGLTVFDRDGEYDVWTAFTLITDDVLKMPEIGIEVPVAAFYEDVDVSLNKR